MPVDGEGKGVADFGIAHDTDQFGTAGDLFPTDVGDNIVDLDTGLGGRGAVGYGFDCCTLGQAVALGFCADGGDGQTYIGLGYITLFNNAVGNLPGFVDGDSKTDVVNGCFVGGIAGVLGVGNTDDLTVEVEQRTAGVAGVDGAVGLHQPSCCRWT